MVLVAGAHDPDARAQAARVLGRRRGAEDHGLVAESRQGARLQGGPGATQDETGLVVRREKVQDLAAVQGKRAPKTGSVTMP